MNKNKSQADRKVEMFKAVLLDYHIKFLYVNLDKIETSLSKLKEKECDKTELEKELSELFRQLYYQFVSLIACVDEKLSEEMKRKIDTCRDNIVSSMADTGINLYVTSKYNEHIHNPFWQMKREIISDIFRYDGK